MNINNLSEQPIELNSQEFVVGDMVVIQNHIMGPLGSDSLFCIIEIKSDFLGDHVSMTDTGTKILVEVEGGIWSGGRHTRGKGYLGDMEKYNQAALLGYTVLRSSTEQVKSGLALKKIEQLVG